MSPDKRDRMELVKEAIERIAARFAADDVDYLVVGGVAVVLHGYLRSTADLDLVVQLERDNILLGVTALEALGYRPRPPVDGRSLADPAARAEMIRDEGLTFFSFWNPSDPVLEVDIFVEEPFAFDAAKVRAIEANVGSVSVPIAAIDDLVDMKRRVGRPIDHEDIEALVAIRDHED